MDNSSNRGGDLQLAVSSKLENGHQNPKKRFIWLQQFIFCSCGVFLFIGNALGLCHVLARPCPKPRPQIWDLSPDLRDQWEIDRSEVQLLRKLGHGNFGEVWYGKSANIRKLLSTDSAPYS